MLFFLDQMKNNNNSNRGDPDTDIKKDIDFVIAMMTPGEGNTPVTQKEFDDFKRETDMRFKLIHNKIFGIAAAIAHVSNKLKIEKNKENEAAKEQKKAPEPMHTTP